MARPAKYYLQVGFKSKSERNKNGIHTNFNKKCNSRNKKK